MTACDLNLDSQRRVGRKTLEVIVTSPGEALEAEHGGADRLEIVRSLDQGGLTPSLQTIESIVKSVRIPVRIMLRESASMSIADEPQLEALADLAHQIAQFPVEGLVLGFVDRGAIDQRALRQILPAAPRLAVTFHRAFEHLHAPFDALSILRDFPQVDRSLLRLGDTGSSLSLGQLKHLQQAAAPGIRFIIGVGLDHTLLPALRHHPEFQEVHVGRGAREPETVFGAVSRAKVARLKSALL